MKLRTIVFAAGLIAFGFSYYSCAKNSNPQPPIHDTVTVIKNDTLKLTDTLYGTKPDPTVNLTKGLLLYLPFSGNIADSSGNNNPTVAVGSVLTYDTHGYANNAFGGTGSGERIYVTNNGSISFDTAYSVSFDFMTRSTNYQTYLSMVDPATGNGPTFNIGTTVAGSSSLATGVQDSTGGCNGPGDPHQTDTTSFTPQAESWYNWISIWHKGTVHVYINGQLISTKTGLQPKALLCPSSQVIVGAWWNGGPQSINGKLDNIRLYNRVLTPNEIIQLSKNYQVTSTSSQRPTLHTR